MYYIIRKHRGLFARQQDLPHLPALLLPAVRLRDQAHRAVLQLQGGEGGHRGGRLPRPLPRGLHLRRDKANQVGRVNGLNAATSFLGCLFAQL